MSGEQDDSDALSVDLTDDYGPRVVELDMQLGDLPHWNQVFFSMHFPMPPAPRPNHSSVASRRSADRAITGTEFHPRRHPRYHKKDRVLFLGVPPAVISPDQPAVLDIQHFLILSNLHWMTNEADVYDAAYEYGLARGVHIFESAGRKKSEGVALIEFNSPEGAVKAKNDHGRAWTARQGTVKPVLVHYPTPQVIEALRALPRYGHDLAMQHWTRAPGMSQQLIDAVYAVVQKVPPRAYYEPDTMGASRAVPQIRSNPPDKTRLPLPSAVEVLVKQIQKHQI